MQNVGQKGKGQGSITAKVLHERDYHYIYGFAVGANICF